MNTAETGRVSGLEHRRDRDVAGAIPEEILGFLSKRSLKNIPFSVVIADARKEDLPLVYVNPEFERTTGHSAADAIGRNCRFLQGEGTDPADRARIREAIRKGEPVNVDILNYAPDGKPFTNHLMITPLRDDDGRIAFFLGMQSVVSEDTRAAQRAVVLETRLAELQHRVKNHLSMILAMIKVEAQKRPADEVIDLLRRRVEVLSLLYQAFSHEEDGASDTIPLAAYLSRVISTVELLDGRPGIGVDTSLERMDVDQETAAQVGMILSEALTNAYEHGFPQQSRGHIRVDLAGDGDGRVSLSVRDDGNGLDGAAWPSEERLGGRLVMAMAENLDGTVDLSDAPGGGTVFALRFPLHPSRSVDRTASAPLAATADP